MGLVGRREAISAPTVGYASDSTPVSTAIVLGPSVTMRSVRKSSQSASTISTTHTAHSDQANQAAVRLLILPTPRPCFLVPFVTTITLPPSPSPRHSDNRYRCLMERQSDKRRRVPSCTRWRIKLRVRAPPSLSFSLHRVAC